MNDDKLSLFIASELGISREQADKVIAETDRLYSQTMIRRFGNEKIADRLKRTNPFLLRIRGIHTVRDWAESQVKGLLYSSEEEAVGHVLELIAKVCHPIATEPEFSADLDFEVAKGNEIRGYQIKMSWDCMPMSSRKNLSKTITTLTAHYASIGKSFTGIFAPCYGKATTTRPKGQKYIALRSRELWTEVSGGLDLDYDVKVGTVCELLCSETRAKIIAEIVTPMTERLITLAIPLIGDTDGQIDFRKLFRVINK